jgi:hypothetical protein
MDTFCLIAFIPCILIAIWLLIELRKYVGVSKKLSVVKKRYHKYKDQDDQWGYETEDDYVQSIPPPQTTQRRGYGQDDHDFYDDNNAEYSYNHRSREYPGVRDTSSYDDYYEDDYGRYEEPRNKPRKRRTRKVPAGRPRRAGKGRRY